MPALLFDSLALTPFVFLPAFLFCLAHVLFLFFPRRFLWISGKSFRLFYFALPSEKLRLNVYLCIVLTAQCFPFATPIKRLEHMMRRDRIVFLSLFDFSIRVYVRFGFYGSLVGRPQLCWRRLHRRIKLTKCVKLLHVKSLKRIKMCLDGNYLNCSR